MSLFQRPSPETGGLAQIVPTVQGLDREYVTSTPAKPSPHPPGEPASATATATHRDRLREALAELQAATDDDRRRFIVELVDESVDYDPRSHAVWLLAHGLADTVDADCHSYRQSVRAYALRREADELDASIPGLEADLTECQRQLRRLRAERPEGMQREYLEGGQVRDPYAENLTALATQESRLRETLGTAQSHRDAHRYSAGRLYPAQDAGSQLPAPRNYVLPPAAAK